MGTFSMSCTLRKSLRGDTMSSRCPVSLADVGDREAQLGESRRGELDPDRLVLDTVERHALHSGEQVELILDPLGDGVQLGQREALSRKGGAHHRDVSEVVVDEGADHALGQLGRRVDDLVAHILPDDVELFLHVLVEDFDPHLGMSVSRPGVDVVALGNLGERLLDGAGDEELDVLHVHAGHERGDHGVAHRDRRIFLAGEVVDHGEAVGR
jgi:hypothetical protein